MRNKRPKNSAALKTSLIFLAVGLAAWIPLLIVMTDPEWGHPQPNGFGFAVKHSFFAFIMIGFVSVPTLFASLIYGFVALLRGSWLAAISILPSFVLLLYIWRQINGV